jgi:hypothetical protein
MDDKGLLELCLKISGSFENGAPDYHGVTGNFDGQGISVGVLQWNAGQGSLQIAALKHRRVRWAGTRLRLSSNLTSIISLF